jgi:hypothetical protein
MMPSWLSWLSPELIMLVVLGGVVISSLLLWLYVFVIRSSVRRIHTAHDDMGEQLEHIGENLDYIADAVEKLADHHHIDGGPTNPTDPQPIIVQPAIERAVPWEDPYATEVQAPGIVQTQDLGLELFAEPENPQVPIDELPAQDDEPETGPMPVPVATRAKVAELHGLPPVPEPAPTRTLQGERPQPQPRYRAAVQHVTSGPITIPDQTPRPPIIRPPVPPRGSRKAGRHAHPDDREA